MKFPSRSFLQRLLLLFGRQRQRLGQLGQLEAVGQLEVVAQLEAVGLPALAGRLAAAAQLAQVARNKQLRICINGRQPRRPTRPALQFSHGQREYRG